MTDHLRRMSLLAVSADLGMSRLDNKFASKSTPRSDSSVKSRSVQNALCVPGFSSKFLIKLMMV